MAYILGADLARLGQDSSCYIIIEEGDPHKVVFIKEVPKKKNKTILIGGFK